MYTEEQAKKRWCPVVVIMATNGTSDAKNCIASQCMWWRWAETWVVKETGEPAQAGEIYVNDEIEIKFTVDGYCGIAGAPK